MKFVHALETEDPDVAGRYSSLAIANPAGMTSRSLTRSPIPSLPTALQRPTSKHLPFISSPQLHVIHSAQDQCAEIKTEQQIRALHKMQTDRSRAVQPYQNPVPAAHKSKHKHRCEQRARSRAEQEKRSQSKSPSRSSFAKNTRVVL